VRLPVRVDLEDAAARLAAGIPSVGRIAASSAGEWIAASSAETTTQEQIVTALAQADQTVCHRKWCRTNWAARKQKNCFGWLTSRLRMPTEFPPPLLG
jgi:hypothetical protein